MDCGVARSCGFGIQIGSLPWYKGRASGGEVFGNAVANAMIGINIDALSGPMRIQDNLVRSSVGSFASDCGSRIWPAANIGPASRHFVVGDPSNLEEGSIDTSSCLLNRQPHR